LREFAEERLTTEEIKNDILFHTDSNGRNAWYIAAFGSDLEAMREIWDLAKERLSTEELKHEMLLRTDRGGMNAWHIAAYGGEIDVMREIWELAKERLTTEEININLCYAKSVSE